MAAVKEVASELYFRCGLTDDSNSGGKSLMRIGSSFAGFELRSQHSFVRLQNELDLSSIRLSTMQRISSAGDDPAGLVAVESLTAELAAINAAADNAARAGGVVRIADSALGQVTGLLDTIEGNLVAAASDGHSDSEQQALQMETDAALEAIDLISHTTSLGGERLLDGDDLTFAFSPDVRDTTTVTLPAVDTSSLGSAAGLLRDLSSSGSANLIDGDHESAAEILAAARGQVVGARAQLGAFEHTTIGTATRVLEGMEESLTTAFSRIADTDVAEETARFARFEILAEASILSLLSASQNRGRIGNLFAGVG